MKKDNSMQRFAYGALICMCLIFPDVGVAAAESAAMRQLRASVNAVIEVLRQKEVPFEQRRDRVSTIVRARFDFAYMARSALGPNWNALNAEQQQHFTDVFTELMESSYMAHINAYRDETVSYIKEQENQGRVMIDTEIFSAGDSIPISYKLVNRAGQWLVYDVVIENVSLVRNYRSSYGDLFMREGYDGLIDRMEKKVNELRSSEGGT